VLDFGELQLKLQLGYPVARPAFADGGPGRDDEAVLTEDRPRLADREAGYDSADAAVAGDPASKYITRLARDLGWRGERPPGR